jgi:hypothetical protein
MPRYETRMTFGFRDSQTFCRRHEGIEALVAISCDSAISFLFFLIGFSIRLAWKLTTTALEFAIRLACVPYRVLKSTCRRYVPRAEKKPAWAGFEGF